MPEKIRIGVCGYGNLGRGVETEIPKNPDMELAAVFTRRDPEGPFRIDKSVPVVRAGDAAGWKGKIDVMILCGGSAKDLPGQGPEFAEMFNTVDSFDTHAKAFDYYISMDGAAKRGNNVAVISSGWDPGLFSLMRMYMGAIVPDGKSYSFWGKGVSQGHSGAIRGIDGVAGAVQYSIPNESAMERIRNGETPELTAREKHERLCYVALKDGADAGTIEKQIKEMPDYFSDYDTTVHFISLSELNEKHGRLPHGGNVIHAGKTGDANRQSMELSLKLDSNPEFTSSILIASARAAYRLFKNGETGAKTVFEIPPIMFSTASLEGAIRTLL